MQKVFDNCYALDARCYEDYGLTEDILIENASSGLAQYIRKHFEKESSLLIVAGKGNNAADGIALARQLHGDYSVSLCIPFELQSKMAVLQLKRALLVGIKVNKTLLPSDMDADIVVDALFGVGLNRDLDEETINLLGQLNEMKGHKIACDIPTGVGTKGLMPMAFMADVTLAMGARKEALYLDENKDAVGKIECVDLGVSSKVYEGSSQMQVLEACDIKLPTRAKQNSHKGNFGHAAVFCGEKEGAGIIAGMASAVFGAGLSTLIVHENIMIPPYLMQATIVPENTSALAIGMGLGGYFESEFLQKYVIQSPLPIVLDADSFLSEEILSILSQKKREVVITPHPKEFVVMWEILTAEQFTVSQVQSKRFEMVRMFSAKYPHVTLLLKGANTLILQEEQLYINALGSSKLSKGGSGDVLSGLIVSLLAQGYTGIDAAIQASLTLVMAANNYEGASYAMLPTDIIAEVARLEVI